MSLYSYVVRYDSGFAPNPFYGYCTLATCKPRIRSSAQIDDWIVGSGSGDKAVNRAGHLVYAMRVTETLLWDQFGADPRFERKKPFRFGSRMQTCGDNIYYRSGRDHPWRQRDSFHSLNDGSPDPKHISIDTRVDRVLVSSDYIYLGGEGPLIPDQLRDPNGRPLSKTGRGYAKFEDPRLIAAFVSWIRSLGSNGFQGPPHEWLTLRGKA